MAIAGARNVRATMVESLQPDPELEAAFWHRGKQRVVGLDEVGRGCLAGPVVAAACVLPPSFVPPLPVRDSKQLTRAQRELLAQVILEHAIAVTIGAASHREVDRLNVRRATALAMARALRRLGEWDHVFYDGLPMPEFSSPCFTAVVNGDERCLSIACAAIVAKVTRDRLMARLARRFPFYGWERNAGYGTAEHLAALEAQGVSPFHRRTFSPVGLSLNATHPRQSCSDQDLER